VPDSIEAFIAALKEWATQQPGILAVAIIGSHARTTARQDSDVDVVAIVDDPAHYLKTSGWLQHFGQVHTVSDENWGLLQSKRVHYADGMEVEFGITVRTWASTDPVDPGTKKVVLNGMRVLYDPEALLESLLTTVRP
jgi:hypothetical protein